MALIPFIGRVLSHMNAEVVLVTFNLFYTRELFPGNASAATCVYNTGTIESDPERSSLKAHESLRL